MSEETEPTTTVTLRALRRLLSDMGKAKTGPLAGCVCEVHRDKVDGKLAVDVWVKETPADWGRDERHAGGRRYRHCGGGCRRGGNVDEDCEQPRLHARGVLHRGCRRGRGAMPRFGDSRRCPSRSGVEMRAAIAVEGGHLADGQIAVLDGATMITIGDPTPPAGHGGGA